MVTKMAGVSQPEYHVEAFMLYATIWNTKIDFNLGNPPNCHQDKIAAFCTESRNSAEIANHCGFEDIKHFTVHYLKPLLELQMTVPCKPNSKSQ